jgi:plastocyanin
MLSRRSIPRLLFLAGATALIAFGTSAAKDQGPRLHQMIVVPEEDRFTPFALTIRSGDTVEWVNNDTDDHTLVSDDFFNNTGPTNLDQLLPGTDSNGGVPAPGFKIQFNRPGTFVYYCRFHSHLDADHQPTAPGPKGGIQGEKDPTQCDPAGSDTCNFGTPMSGVITVLPGGEQNDQGEDH